MKKYTLEDFKNFEEIDGRIICPTGDYTEINQSPPFCSFGEGCSFGEWCSFGERCSFEAGRVKNGTYFACDKIGSERRKAYFFLDGNGEMFVRAGCWFSGVDGFIKRVKEAHGGTRYEREYLAAVELARIVLN